MKKITIVSTLLLSIGGLSAQMGAKIDQFYMDYSLINPAAMNTHDQGHVTLLYNKMFSAVPGSPQTTVLNVVMPVPSKNTGYGLYYMRERVGFSEMHNAYASYAYSFPIAGSTNLNLGMSVGALSQNFDMSKAIYISSNDPIIKSLTLTPPVTRADLRASAFINGEKWFAGFAISRLSKPRFDYVYYNYTAAYQLQSQGSLMFGYNIDLGDDVILKPALYASAYDFNYFRLQYNVSMWYQDKFWIGVGGNDIGQIGGNIGFSPQDDIKVSYSYNTPTGGQRIALGNSHEFHTFVGFAALGGGARSGSVRDDDGADLNSANGGEGDDGEGDGNGGFGMSKEVTITSLEDMKSMGTGNDTSKIKLPAIEKVKPGPGFYLVAGLHSSEAKANKQIKDLYKKGVLSYKIYDPSNKSYYVYLKDFASEKDANRGIFYYEASVPQVWIREVK
ncbi:MAG: type IX secretion system membrane protein PorP/SprF [Bacteroidetes bacterium]|nr:type IX secretion system membrane protein PorP/SprF [Bacteroidota bacterium]